MVTGFLVIAKTLQYKAHYGILSPTYGNKRSSR